MSTGFNCSCHCVLYYFLNRYRSGIYCTDEEQFKLAAKTAVLYSKVHFTLDVLSRPIDFRLTKMSPVIVTV